MNIEEEKSLKKLREIFFAERDDRQEEFEREIESIKYRLNNKDAKIEAYYPIVADLLEHKIKSSEEEVARVLSPVLGKALKKQIEESKDDIIDALYPIMGETIKKTVAESIKEIYNSLNQKIDNALRRGIFSKQVKSKITGISANDIILQGAFPFSVKEIFLIHEESGILISHVSNEKDNSSDADLVSGMLTAIKDFVKESFNSDDGNKNLYEIQYGESKIIIERGLYSYLAIVNNGQEPVEFDIKVKELNTKIHKEYSKDLREFNGDLEELRESKILLAEFLELFSKSHETPISEEEPVKPILKYLLVGMLIFLILIWGIIAIPEFIGEKNLSNKVSEKLYEVSSINVNNINWNNKSNEVTLNGYVNSYLQKEKIDSALRSIPELEKLNNKLSVLFSNVDVSEIKTQIDLLLSDRLYKDISYSLSNDQITLSGKILNDESKALLSHNLSRIPGIRSIINNLQVIEKRTFSDEESIKILERMKLYFDFREYSISSYHVSRLDSIVPFLIRSKNYKLYIKGYSDYIGAEPAKRTIAKKRAESVENYLISRGFEKENSKIFNYVYDDSESPSNHLRKVEFLFERDFKK